MRLDFESLSVVDLFFFCVGALTVSHNGVNVPLTLQKTVNVALSSGYTIMHIHSRHSKLTPTSGNRVLIYQRANQLRLLRIVISSLLQTSANSNITLITDTPFWILTDTQIRILADTTIRILTNTYTESQAFVLCYVDN